MKITVRRLISKNKATTSLVFIDDDFECVSLEDAFQNIKIYGSTRIPAGTYRIGVRAHGRFHSRYLKKFSFHKGMLEVLDVPNFTEILIHIGNSIKDTLGCLLIGRFFYPETPDFIRQSTKAYTKFYKKVIDEAIAGNLTIEYVDEDK